jgi:hypothetical protein
MTQEKALQALHSENERLGLYKDAYAQPEQEPVAWLLTDKNINSLQVDSIQRLIDRLKHAHHTDLCVRINGQDEWFEADWLKHMVRVTPPQRTEQEPVAWADIQKEAQQIVESKFLWKKFIDGTPLSNDIACWMADFAQQYTTPPQRTDKERILQLIKELRPAIKSLEGMGKGKTTDEWFDILVKDIEEKNT